MRERAEAQRSGSEWDQRLAAPQPASPFVPGGRRPGRAVARPGLELGFRRVGLVRAWVGRHAVRFEVEGVVHRRPVTRPVSAAMASRLAASGVPLVVRSHPGGGEG